MVFMSLSEPSVVLEEDMNGRIIEKHIPAKEQIQKKVRLDPSMMKDIEFICAQTNRAFDDVVTTLLKWAIKHEMNEIAKESPDSSNA